MSSNVYSYRSGVTDHPGPERLRRRGNRWAHRQDRRSDERDFRRATWSWTQVSGSSARSASSRRASSRRVDPADEKVYVRMTKDQIKDAPDYDPDRNRPASTKTSTATRLAATTRRIPRSSHALSTDSTRTRPDRSFTSSAPALARTDALRRSLREVLARWSRTNESWRVPRRRSSTETEHRMNSSTCWMTMRNAILR